MKNSVRQLLYEKIVSERHKKWQPAEASYHKPIVWKLQLKFRALAQFFA